MMKLRKTSEGGLLFVEEWGSLMISTNAEDMLRGWRDRVLAEFRLSRLLVAASRPRDEHSQFHAAVCRAALEAGR